ncbi:hypothetical protein [Moraxella lacunata]|uniref:hypothetical protein n=1 Tax=Moraxella lacunata TaxID=477 RepID=UPI003EE2BDEE
MVDVSFLNGKNKTRLSISPKLIMINPYFLGNHHKYQAPYFCPIPFTPIRFGV